MRRVLVTGASGFVGRYSLGPLVEQGYVVHAVSRTAPAGQAAARSVNWHRADLHDPASRGAVLAATHPTHILHFAWYTEHGKYWSSPANLDWVVTSLALAREFADSGGERFVVAGTCAEYEWADDGPLAERSSRLAPSSLYGVAKNALREVLMAFAELGGLSVAWGRIFSVYGPGEDPRRLVPSIMCPLLSGQRAEVTSGHLRRDYLYVADVARAFVELLSSEVEGPINVASGKTIPLRTLAEVIGRKAGRSDLLTVDTTAERGGECIEVAADITRLDEEVGFRPAVELEEGIEQTIASCRERIDVPG